MKKTLNLFILLIFTFAAGCGPGGQNAMDATPTAAPTETPGPVIRFITPQDGAMLDYEALTFQIEPVPEAEGYGWLFIQNGNTVWDTIRDEGRLMDSEYSIPVAAALNGLLVPGELQVGGKARVNGVWTDPGLITIRLPERAPTPTPTLVPTATLIPPATGPVEIRWFVGLGGGASENQQYYERNLVYKFNQTHPNIKLTLQVVNDSPRARELLAEQFSQGNGPDIVGPMGFQASNTFPDGWFDLSALIADAGYDVSIFQPELFDMYKNGRGVVGLPFTVYPAAVFYNKSLFDAARLAYPPEAYGKPYLMPDGTQAEWNWDTLADVARLLTLDSQGRNAADPAFDATHIVQYGFIPQWECTTCFASFWEANQLYNQGNHAVVPPAWKKAWEWYYGGMWGRQPFIPNQPALSSAHFGGYGNPFQTDYCAMALSQSWLMGPNMAGGQHWDLGAIPATDGVVHGRIDADSIRIWKGAPHPREAFQVLTYLLGPGYADVLRALGGVPAISSEQEAFFKTLAQTYPWVRHWEVLKAGLDYPDIPSGEGYMPNFLDGWNRMAGFGNLLASNGTISVPAELETLRHDLEAIFTR